MKEKILKQLELQDDQVNIEKLIKEMCHDNPIYVYVDYRDLEGLQYLVVDCDTLDEFCDKIYEAYQDGIGEDEYDLARLIAQTLIEKYNTYDEVSPDLWDYIQQSVWDYVEVSIPYQSFLRQTIRVNLFVTYNNSNDAFEDRIDITTLTEFIKRLGYKKPKTVLKNVYRNLYSRSDKFLDSLHSEIINSFEEQTNHLCFIGEMTIEDYYKISLSTTANVIVPKDVTCGFVDPYVGGGSILGIQMPSEFKIRGSNIKKIIVEHTKQKYSVDAIYGLTSECYKELKVE